MINKQIAIKLAHAKKAEFPIQPDEVMAILRAEVRQHFQLHPVEIYLDAQFMLEHLEAYTTTAFAQSPMPQAAIDLLIEVGCDSQELAQPAIMQCLAVMAALANHLCEDDCIATLVAALQTRVWPAGFMSWTFYKTPYGYDYQAILRLKAAGSSEMLEIPFDSYILTDRILFDEQEALS